MVWDSAGRLARGSHVPCSSPDCTRLAERHIVLAIATACDWSRSFGRSLVSSMAPASVSTPSSMRPTTQIVPEQIAAVVDFAVASHIQRANRATDILAHSNPRSANTDASLVVAFRVMIAMLVRHMRHNLWVVSTEYYSDPYLIPAIPPDGAIVLRSDGVGGSGWHY